MKNLAKIFVTVVAAMAAYACTTDTTETLGVKPEGQTTLTLSIEESRTQLGEKTGNLYPVTWCEDDVVAANGVKSTAIEIKGNGNAATFTFASEVTRPYSLVYPAPAEGVTAATEGLQVVTFLAEQAYTAGTFCDGAAPMYGYAEEVAEGETAPAIQLQHLTGVLRFELKGTHTLAGMTIATESGKIAGNFDLDCTTGALTAHEDAVNTVTVTFGGGLILTDEATPIYVAVPAGEYGLVTVTLTSTDAENNTMVVRFNSDYHPVKAATVKEFGTVTFAPGATTKPSGELIITNQADLLKLAKWSENKMLDEVTKVTVANDIDMSGVTNWHGIELFPAITFDGGNKTIKGLTAPLFGAVDGATIQNVKLTEVNITETERLQFGSLVCLATSSTISNCEAAGAIVYKNTSSLVPTLSTFGVGGLIGKIALSTVSGCTNKVDITISDYAPAKAASATYIGTGGIVGSSYDASAETNVSTISNCHNLGNIVSNQSNGSWQPSIGGIIGVAYKVTIKNVVNGELDAITGKAATDKGNITIPKTSGCACIASGGIAGYVVAVDLDTATNYGTVEFGKGVGYPYIGTCFGSLINSTGTLKNVDNYGTLVVPNVSFSNGTPYLGGVIGRMANTKWTIDDCDNYSDLTIEVNFGAIKSNNMSCFGGIVGGTEGGTIQNCDNYANLTVKGTFGKTSDAETYGGSVYVGGIVGRMSDTGGVIKDCHNGNNAGNANSVTVEATCGGLLFAGGVAGYFNGKTLTNASNHANLTIEGSSAGYQDSKAPAAVPAFGGVVGYGNNSNLTVDNCDNLHSGDTEANHIKFDINFTTAGHIQFGGVFGNLNASKSVGNCDNNCEIVADIDLSATSGSSTLIGGVAGKITSTSTNCTNGALGDITISGTAKANVGVSGLNCSTKETVSCSNAGDITVSVVNTEGAAYVMGLAWTGTSGANHSNFTNSGNITYSGHSKTNVFITGGAYTPSGILTNVNNTGNLVANVTDLACTLKIGGLVRSSSTVTLHGCGNSGDIVFNGTSTKAVYLGGLAGDVNGACKTTGDGFTNSGAIKFLGTTTSSAYVGGLAGAATVAIGNITTLNNTGLVTNYDAETGLTGKANTLYVGGCIGSVTTAAQTAAQTAAFANAGDIYVRNAEGVYTTAAYIGGVAGNTTQKISNAKAVCDIAAIGFTESAEAPIVGVGMITGTHRGTSALVNACTLGGRIAFTEENGEPVYKTLVALAGDKEVVDPETQETVIIPGNPNEISFFTKIYGGNWEAASATNCDGCSYVSAIE